MSTTGTCFTFLVANSSKVCLVLKFSIGFVFCVARFSCEELTIILCAIDNSVLSVL